MVKVLNHALIKHKLSIMREEKTSNYIFKQNLDEIAMLMAYEVTKDYPLKEKEIETPICKTTGYELDRDIILVPILRAGVGLVDGFRRIMPTAKVGHIGMYRDEETHEPHEYYCKLPSPIEERLIIVTDPMLATGGSAVDAIDQIKKHGGKKIKFMCIIAAPEGLEKLHKAHPDVQIYVGHLDRQLNENAYICPGLGDAGDRIFGTK